MAGKVLRHSDLAIPPSKPVCKPDFVMTDASTAKAG